MYIVPLCVTQTVAYVVLSYTCQITVYIAALCVRQTVASMALRPPNPLDANLANWCPKLGSWASGSPFKSLASPPWVLCESSVPPLLVQRRRLSPSDQQFALNLVTET